MSLSAAACAVCRAIERTSPQKAAIKWVNDIYIADKKVCGILAESVISGEKADSIVIGIGVNLSEPEGGFAPEIADRACAVFKNAPQGYLQTLAAALLNELYAALNSPKEEILNAYRGVSLEKKKERPLYTARIHIRGNYVIGRYGTSLEAAVAYNKAIDILKKNGLKKDFQPNYIEDLSPAGYAEIYSQVKISPKIIEYRPAGREEHEIPASGS